MVVDMCKVNIDYMLRYWCQSVWSIIYGPNTAVPVVNCSDACSLENVVPKKEARLIYTKFI